MWNIKLPVSRTLFLLALDPDTGSDTDPDDSCRFRGPYPPLRAQAGMNSGRVETEDYTNS